MVGNKDPVQHAMVAAIMIIMVALSAVHVMELEKKDINQKS
jgi:hypothetical protein